MTRIVKKPNERRLEIMQTAEKLFGSQGFEETSVSCIIEKIGIAKGTFYYYFKSKEDLLKAIVDDLLEEMIVFAQFIQNDITLSPLEKIEKIFSSQNKQNFKAENIKDSLHIPKNRELHEILNVQIVVKFAPVVSEIVEEGIVQGIFKTINSLETIQFLLTGSQFLFDEGLFAWNKKEWQIRRKVMQRIIEKSLGAKKDSFKFLSKL